MSNLDLRTGDCIEVMRELPDNSVGSIMTDPPYGLELMGRSFDSFKPRRITCAVPSDWYEDAGLEAPENTPEVSLLSFQGNLVKPDNWKEVLDGAAPSYDSDTAWKSLYNADSDDEDEDEGEVPVKVTDMHHFEEWNTIWLREAYRILKPGGVIKIFNGTRTYHRVCSAVERVGFEIEDLQGWIYSSGFPKSLNLDKALRKKVQNSNVLSKVSECLTKYVMAAEQPSKPVSAMVNTASQPASPLPSTDERYLVIIAELNSLDLPLTIGASMYFAAANVATWGSPSPSLVKSAERLLPSLNPSPMIGITVACDAKEWVNENLTRLLTKDAEVLRTWHGKLLSSKTEDIDALCVEILHDLKLTTLKQSKTFQSFDTTQQMVCVSATSVTITESIRDSLTAYMGDMLENLSRRYSGFGTALKPAHEPVIIARKPL